MDNEKPDADSAKGIAAKAGEVARGAASKAVQGSKVAGDHIAGASRTVARKTVEGAQAVRPHAARAAEVAADQAARAAALTASRVRRHMPKHQPGEPTRPAILDSGGDTASVLIEDSESLASFALLSSQYLLADFVTSREQDENRWKKMERVLGRQRLAVDEVGVGEDGAVGVLIEYGRSLPSAEQIAFLVDLYFLDPFAPYTLKSDKVTRIAGLKRIAELVSDDDAIVDRIAATRQSALAAHTRRSLGKIGLMGIAAAAVLGVAGFMAAPLVGAAIGGAAGLGGASAVAHGLAILGGGALVAGGAGMAGGMWLVAGVGAAAGLIAAGGGTALYELGSATARGELVKLQITFKLGLLDANRDMAKAQQVITNLIEQADATRAVLEDERRLNDDNSKRVEDLETTLRDIEEAIGWMQREREMALESA